MPFCTAIVVMRHQIQAVLFEWQWSIRIDEVRLISIDQVFDAHVPVALPPLRYVAFVPLEIGIHVIRIHIEVEVFRICPVVGNSSIWT